MLNYVAVILLWIRSVVLFFFFFFFCLFCFFVCFSDCVINTGPAEPEYNLSLQIV